MKRLTISILILTIIFSFSCSSKSGKQKIDDREAKITFLESKTDKKIDVLIDGELFTSFRWPDNISKPVLYPIFTSTGTEITRGFPIAPKTGERADHPHQIGMWLTYGNVDGFDFWGNGSKGLGTKNENGGVIKHLNIKKITDGNREGSFVTSESWVDPSGIELLKENTEFHFIASGTNRIIDRITTLTAGEKVVNMPDTKEGMFGIRLARQMELPSNGTVELYNSDGTITKVKDSLNVGITGNYISSQGITGEAVWGTRAKWMKLDGKIGEEQISVVICDHPQNPNYPTYWHARGYGLFAANPLGILDFTKGKENLNFSIPAGKSATFRYRVIIGSGAHLTEEDINAFADSFANMY